MLNNLKGKEYKHETWMSFAIKKFNEIYENID
jgi:hypothetical protein